jgi:2-methylcitrate dehydratase PrpD
MAAKSGSESQTYTRDLAQFAHDMRLADVPSEARHEALRVLIDCLGCGVAGLVAPGTRIAIDLARDEHGPLEGNVISSGLASVLPACYANTTAMNSLDFDVYGPEAHLSPVVVSAALAMGDAVKASGADVFAALCAGLEVGGRVGAALRRVGMGEGGNMGPVRGEGNVVFGAAVAAGRLLGLNAEQMHHALGIAGYSATVPTMRKFLESNLPMTKYDHLAQMTQGGVQAALLAKRGFTGDTEVLEGEETGFWRFAGALGCDWQAYTTDLGRHWVLPEVSYKYYPASLYNNSAVHEAQRLVREHQLTTDEIERIEVRSARSGGERQARPAPHHYLSAWGNGAYSVAAGVFNIRPLRSWEEPHVFQRTDILALMQKVQFRPLREGEVTSTGNYFERWAPVRVTIEARGQSFEAGRDYHLLMDDADLAAKFHDNVGGLLTDDAAKRLERACWDLEKLERAQDLTNILAEADVSQVRQTS